VPALRFAYSGLHLLRIDKLLAPMIPDTGSEKDALQSEVEALCATARWCYARGWVPATSGNFSVRAGRHILITPTGLDKGALTPGDLLEIDPEGRAVAGKGKPSAETGLHTVIYRERPGAQAILHVHTIWNTLLSGRFLEKGYVPIEGYELLKGLAGVSTHEHEEQVPIIGNSQDYALLSTNLAEALDGFPRAHGVLLSQHGLYTWGESVAEARRHLEALEFLFEVEGRRLMSLLG
jgi:methylthioribulose-1-phosphate dehydratase